MFKKFAVLALAFVAAVLVACGGRTAPGFSGSSGTNMLPSIDRDLAVTASVPASVPRNTIGEELPDEGLGSIDAKSWKAVVGGYQQTQRSQVLAFPPGTTLTIRNLSKINQHTLDVVKVITGHVAEFPHNVNLSMTAHGNGKLAAGYASGVINPGKSVTVHLDKEGTYIIGCAFHYEYAASPMRDVLIVSKKVKPGPQATPTHDPTMHPTTSPTHGGGGW